jgi:hypothetical protein
MDQVPDRAHLLVMHFFPVVTRRQHGLYGATRYGKQGFAGAGEMQSSWGTALPAPLSSPDLIIQDELHLIAGLLGTMSGLYETAIDALCVRDLGGAEVRPKIVASTATVRRAGDQVRRCSVAPTRRSSRRPAPTAGTR